MEIHTLKQIAKGCVSSVPLVYRIVGGKSDGSQNARYCYSVWLRHLTSTWDKGLRQYPLNVVELGPGGSIGNGILALLLGAETYTALDVRDNTGRYDTDQLLQELVELLLAKTPIPGADEFPRLNPKLESYEFPEFLESHVVDNVLDERKTKISQSLRVLKNGRSEDEVLGQVRLVTDWNGTDAHQLPDDHADFVFSQAVLEHALDIPSVYKAIFRWLKPGAMMSHQVDFRSHGTSLKWNGHWEYSDFVWALICGNGKRPDRINRHPYSFHIGELTKAGFDIVGKNPIRQKTQSLKLAKRFASLETEDLETSGAHLVSVKPQ